MKDNLKKKLYLFSSTRNLTIELPLQAHKWQKRVSPFFRAPLPVFKHFQMLDKSCGLQISMGIILGPNSDAGEPNFFTRSKNQKKSENSLQALFESFPINSFTAKQ
jgi:hypothetical protein